MARLEPSPQAAKAIQAAQGLAIRNSDAVLIYRSYESRSLLRKTGKFDGAIDDMESAYLDALFFPLRPDQDVLTTLATTCEALYNSAGKPGIWRHVTQALQFLQHLSAKLDANLSLVEVGVTLAAARRLSSWKGKQRRSVR